MPIIRRHETLSITHRDLLQRLGRLEEEVEQSQRQLLAMTQEHSIKTLVRPTYTHRCSSLLQWLISNGQPEVVFMCVADGQ